MSEIWEQLSHQLKTTPYLGSNSITTADITWFPISILLAFVLPQFKNAKKFAKLYKWHELLKGQVEFGKVYD